MKTFNITEEQINEIVRTGKKVTFCRYPKEGITKNKI